MATKYDGIDKHAAEGTAHGVLNDRATYDHGSVNNLPIWCRYVVIETIFDPTIVDDKKAAYFEHVLRVSNVKYAKVLPRNTIVAQRAMDAQTTASDPPMFLFPMLPPTLSMPCQPGEHVWVMFENPSSKTLDLGYWMCRIVEPGFVEDVNHTHAPRANDPSFHPGPRDTFQGTDEAKYEFRNGAVSTDTDSGSRYSMAETATLAVDDEKIYEKLITTTDGGKLLHIEPVPRYRKRPQDMVIEGSNNALIVLGRDRTGSAAKFKQDDAQGQVVDTYPDDDVDMNTSGAGSIDFVVGRGQTGKTSGKSVENSLSKRELDKSSKNLVENEGDPDLLNDRSRVLVSQKTLVDKNFGIATFNIEMGRGVFQGNASSNTEVKDEGKGDGAIVIKSDKIRLIARSDIEMLVTGYSRDEFGNMTTTDDESAWAAVVIKANGDIVFRPAKHGFIKLGGDSADKGIVCTDIPVVAVDGGISGPPIATTMGGFFAGAKPAGDDNGPALSPGQGKLANKVLIL